MDGLDDIVREFLVESHENLDQLDSDLVALEEQPGSRPLLSSIFRTIHTIKGTSGFLALSKLERLAHVGENLLVDLRDGTRSMDKPVTDVLLAMVDRIRMLLGAIEATGTEGDVAIDDVVARVEAVHAGVPLEAPAPEPASQEATTQDEVEQVDDEHVQQVEAPAELVAAAAGAAAPAPAAPAAPPAPAPAPAAPAAPAAPEATVPAQHPAPAAERVEEHPPTEEIGALRGVGDSAIRVDVDLLDALMRQVGELVLARNQISRLASATAQVDLVRSAQRLNLIAGELQEGVMKTRMQPIDNVFAKMPRIVRDLATACGREVALEVSGGDTELDRGLLEAVKDPLTHLVRNAVDHGIEPSAERVASGKSPKGLLALRAYHAGGQVVVEVSDDGRGVDTVKVAAKAVERGLRTQAQVDTASTADLLQLLFLPGFSTAATVTNVSGRGVGMDVVRTKVENVGGTVDVESTPGKGTVWRLRIPLTLAIMPALTVECNDDVYAVPQVNLLELVALDAQRGRSAIEYVHAAPVYRLRGDLLPLVSLAEVLGVAEPRDPGDPDGETSSVIAVVQADHHRFGLLVDRVLNTEEIVVKPLSPRLKAIGTYAGATVLGDGRVSLILDVQALGRRALIGELDAMARKDVGGIDAAHSGAAEQVLVVGIGGGRRVAMPLQSVTRLEQVRLDQVEHVGGREVVRYRGTILPLARLDRVLGSYGEAMDEELVVVVLTRRGRSVGLVVHEIVDILEDHSEQHSDIDDSGLVGSTVLGERVTERLDVRTAILAADPVFFDDRPEAGTAPDAAWSGIDDLVGAGR
ncbi:chemotaxis protein CheA [Cellulomonas oligotrophica]|uniref:histidine kinase n=1 Tax=Cellulomonas oligotrophica TaxID=931536 RepID=A0A7Y9FJP0_9CELL|nr:chemotaxis protein CheA [Cellulomonas oligotrophica]NYD87271.1 two-component system chemotaxis sensor kinase CheA [Cellulomonas oligotrophica]GIG34053.1 ATPase [Cellulomonas oligotrophica]